MVLNLQLFGGFRLTRTNGKKVHISSRKSRALLAYLAIFPGQNCAREHLMTILWGDCPEEQARQNLRKELSRLRQSFGDLGREGINTDADQICLQFDNLKVDVAQFLTLADSFNIDELKTARKLYTGDFLLGFHLGQDLFEEWSTDLRTYYLERAVSVLIRLANLYVDRNELEQGILALSDAVRLNPLRDDVIRQIMLLLAASGRYLGIVQIYNQHVEQTWDELGCEPDEKTARLFHSLSRPMHIKPKGTMFWPTDYSENTNKIEIVLRCFSGSEKHENRMMLNTEVAGKLNLYKEFSVIPLEDTKSFPSRTSARYLVDGSIRRDINQWICDVTLKDNITGQLKWVGTVESAIVDATHDKASLSSKISARLATAISNAEIGRIILKPSMLLRANEMVLLARHKIQVGNRAGDSEYQRQGLIMAEQAFEKSAGLSIDAIATLGWGYMYRHMMRWSDKQDPGAIAHRYLEELLVLAPDWHITHAHVGCLAYTMGNYREALDRLRQAQLMNPVDPGCNAMLSLFEAACGNSDFAEKFARQSIELNPEYPSAGFCYHSLQTALISMDKPVEALKWGERAAFVAPKNPVVKMILMMGYAKAGLAEKAGLTFSDFDRGSPDLSNALSRGEFRLYQQTLHNDDFLQSMDMARRSVARN